VCCLFVPAAPWTHWGFLKKWRNQRIVWKLDLARQFFNCRFGAILGSAKSIHVRQTDSGLCSEVTYRTTAFAVGLLLPFEVCLFTSRLPPHSMNQGMNQGISEVQSVCMRPLLGQGLYLCQGNFWQIYFFLRPDTTDDGPGPPPVWTRYECPESYLQSLSHSAGKPQPAAGSETAAGAAVRLRVGGGGPAVARRPFDEMRSPVTVTRHRHRAT